MSETFILTYFHTNNPMKVQYQLFCLFFYTAGSYQASVLYSSVYTCQSQSPNSAHHHPHLTAVFLPLVSIRLFSTSVSLFLPCKPVHLYHFSSFHIYAFGNFSSFTAPSHRCGSHPSSFVFVFPFFFCPTHVCGDFLAFWEVSGLLPAFSRCSVGVLPHVDVFLMYFWGGR